ncbi:MAG: ribonuclease P protein component [Terriglobales bacterium]
MQHSPEFRAVSRRGRRRNGAYWVLLALRQPVPAASSRVGLTTPRRLGAAPLRNRIRRRLRALAGGHWAALPPGWDLVLQPRVEAARVPFDRLEAEWTECLRWLARGSGLDSRAK